MPSSVASSTRQAELEQMRHHLVTTWPARWKRMTDQWLDLADTPTDAGWLMHPANYLFRTAGVRWAVDPVQLPWTLPEAPSVDLSPLRSLDVVLLTHGHKDHADISIWQSLADAPIDWIVPACLRDHFVEATGITDSRLVLAEPGQVIHRHGLTVLPLPGLHWERRQDLPAGRLGIDAVGYQVQWPGSEGQGLRTLLLPGDTRTYDATPLLPLVVSPDVLLAHVWLGRGGALASSPALLEAMSRFVLDLSPRQRVVLAHLYETSRPPGDCWTAAHARQVTASLHAHRPELAIAMPMLGDRIEL